MSQSPITELDSIARSKFQKKQGIAMDIQEKLRILFDKIANDKINGSISIAKGVVSELKLLLFKSSSNEIKFLCQFLPYLKQAKPTMSALENTLTLLHKKIKENPRGDLPRICDEVLQIIDESTNTTINVALEHITHTFTANFVSIITTSFSSTVLSLLKRLKAERNTKVYVLESYFGGTRHSFNFVQECAIHQIDASEIKSDALQKQKGKLDFAIIGADRIVNDKGVVNGTPSLYLAESTKILGIPFFVIGESIKTSNSLYCEEGYDKIPWNYITKIFSDSIFTLDSSKNK